MIAEQSGLSPKLNETNKLNLLIMQEGLLAWRNLLCVDLFNHTKNKYIGSNYMAWNIIKGIILLYYAHVCK